MPESGNGAAPANGVRNFRKAIASAEGMAPVVLWIDEIEKAISPAATLAASKVAAATEGFSGAEIEQVVIAASLQGVHDGRPLDTDMLVAEAGATVPLARSRREDVARLREYARERFVPVG